VFAIISVGGSTIIVIASHVLQAGD
jgi:hypothetical protein